MLSRCSIFRQDGFHARLRVGCSRCGHADPRTAAADTLGSKAPVGRLPIPIVGKLPVVGKAPPGKNPPASAARGREGLTSRRDGRCAAIGWMQVRRDKARAGGDRPCVLDAEAPRAATQIRQRASVTSRVEGVDTVVRSAAVLPPFQRWKLVAIPRSPGGTEPAISAGAASRIHAALEVVKSAIGSACVVVEAPVALRCRSSVGRSLFRICR